MNIYIETYGCSANINNSEILSGLLIQSGHHITNNENLSDIIILNTCIVKGKTENKIKRRIQDLSKFYPNKLMIITGCMPETDFKEIKKLNNKAILLGTHHFKEINNLIKDYSENKLINKQKNYLSYKNEEKILLPKKPFNKLISIIQISEGCLGNCTYCKTKLAKGKLFSYPKEKIIKSIKNDLSQGAKEIWLTSQDLSIYGLDKKENKKSQLPLLLKEIINLPHKFKLRLGMMNPNSIYSILDELIEIYKSPKLYKFLHIPIQSASDSVLKHMKRKYKIKIAKEIIEKFKKRIPNITIATDIITGYPTEKLKDHKENINFIKKFKPDVFNLSKFSSHKNTEAGKLKTLHIKIINKRTTELMELHRKTARANKMKFLNNNLKVFVNKKNLEKGFYEARDDFYNIVLINLDKNNKNILGKNINVKIKQVGVHHMIGEIEKK